jgi:hypothetical protein
MRPGSITAGRTAFRIASPIFLASCACLFLFFRLGSIFVLTPHADEITLRLPALDEAKWWMGRPDTGYYIDIADHGYKDAPSSSAEVANWAFFSLVIRCCCGSGVWYFLIRYLRDPVLVGNSGWDPELLSVIVTCSMVGLLVWSWRKRRMPAVLHILCAANWPC